MYSVGLEKRRDRLVRPSESLSVENYKLIQFWTVQEARCCYCG